MSRRWLSEPWPELRELLPRDLLEPPCPPTEDQAAAVAVADDGDPMVVVPESIHSRHVYRELPLRLTPDRLYLRAGAVRRLQDAQQHLPAGFELCLLDCWRSAEFQDELLECYTRATGLDLRGYVSDPDSERLIPPHTTGGAVDLTVAVNGTALALGSDYDDFVPSAHLRFFERPGAASTPELRLVRDLRRVLAHAMLAAGFAPFPTEWWHWSHGDQRWAAAVGASTTAYAPTTAVPVG